MKAVCIHNKVSWNLFDIWYQIRERNMDYGRLKLPVPGKDVVYFWIIGLEFLYLHSNLKDKIMETGSINPTQRELLKLFALDSSEEFAMEIKEVLTKYLLSKLQKETDKLWDAGILNQEVLDRINREDLHAS